MELLVICQTSVDLFCGLMRLSFTALDELIHRIADTGQHKTLIA